MPDAGIKRGEACTAPVKRCYASKPENRLEDVVRGMIQTPSKIDSP